jgi:hypothetical protein
MSQVVVDRQPEMVVNAQRALIGGLLSPPNVNITVIFPAAFIPQLPYSRLKMDILSSSTAIPTTRRAIPFASLNFELGSSELLLDTSKHKKGL